MSLSYGFILLREQFIQELNTTARLYRHEQTGAELLSLTNSDENKVFGITFRTPSPDSTGLAHILEHSVLNGSGKYPVKEPFVELVKGSLNTFLNAMTYPDRTCYPVASQNLQDFYNLIDVYMDAVFNPLLSPFTLDQEGWHYELEDIQAPLTYKGVVFNEMKGAYSQPDNVLGKEIQQSLYPDTPYAYDSGGDPAVIPNLTYDQFKRFHEQYYHPSNARIFFYGDDDPEQRLMLMDEYLRAFEQIDPQSNLPIQAAFEQPRTIETSYEVEKGSADARAFVAVNWLLPEAGDPELTLGLVILEYLLIGTPASQLRKALIESEIGEDLTGMGLETGMRQMLFSTGLKGTPPEKIGDVEPLILNTLAELTDQGVDPDNITAALNTIEFRLRENNTGSFPRGLLLMLRSLENWIYDQDPIAPLAFEAPLTAIKARLAAGERYFEELIRTYLINNPHRTTVVMKPDPELAEKRDAEEKERLAKIRQGMNEAELEAIIEKCRVLKLRQETPDSPEALMTIPMLTLDDLDKEIRRIPIEVIQQGQNTILYHDLFTNGIVYIDLGFNYHVLPQEHLPYLPLFGRALLETGTHQQTFVQLLQRIGRTTGGIRPTTMTSRVRATGETAAWFILRGKAMISQTGDLLTILHDILTDANLENRERFRQMALEEKSSLESRLVQMGHIIVNHRLKARYNEADWAAEQMNGVSYLFFLRSLVERIDSDWPSVQRTLEAIRDRLVSSKQALVNITTDASSWSIVRPQLEDFLANLPAQQVESAAWSISPFSPAEGLTIPAQVNFVGKGADIYQLGYQLGGSILVITNFLSGTWLWEKIRVQGGAYGGFAPSIHNRGS